MTTLFEAFDQCARLLAYLFGKSTQWLLTCFYLDVASNGCVFPYITGINTFCPKELPYKCGVKYGNASVAMNIMG